MNEVIAGFLNETDKIFARKKYKVFLILFGVFCMIVGLLARFANSYIHLSISGLPLFILSMITTIALPLVIFMAVADLFTTEQENGCMKAVMTKPISQDKVFITKVLAILTYCGAVLGVCLVISSAFALVISGMSPMVIAQTFIAYIVSLLPMLPVILFSVLISQAVKSSSGATILSVFGYVIIVVLGTVFPRLYPMLFTSYTGWYKLFIGAFMPLTSILSVIALLMAYVLLFFAGGGTLFKQKEY